MSTVGMDPRAFWEMTPHEFQLTLDGFRAAEDRTMQKLAWVVANTINIHLKKKDRVSISQLLGRVIKSSKQERDR